MVDEQKPKSPEANWSRWRGIERMTLYEFLDLSFGIEPGHADRHAVEYQTRLLRIVRIHFSKTDMARYQNPDWRDNIFVPDAVRWALADCWTLPDRLAEMASKPGEDPDITITDTSTTPLQRQKAQEAVILKALRDAGLDPKRLAKQSRAGKSTERAEIRRKLVPKTQTESIFKKAWQRLLKAGEIAYRD